MRAVAIICVRALGSLLIAMNMSTLGIMLAPLIGMGGNFDSRLWALLAGPLGLVAFGVLMILLSKSLGRLFMAGVPETGPPGPDAQQMLMVGTALIGLFYLASAASDVFDAAWIWFAPILMPETFALDEAGAMSELVRAAGNVAVGGLLLWLARSRLRRKA